MSASGKFLFDECISTRVVATIAASLEKLNLPVPTLKHVMEFHAAGTFDEVWIPAIANEGWIIVTADRGTKGGLKKGAKLPIVCKLHGVTHLVFSTAIHRMTTLLKVSVLLQVWPEIARLTEAPKGSRHSLRVGKGRRFEVIQIEPKLDQADEQPPSQ